MLHPCPLEFLGSDLISWGAISWNWICLCWSFLKENVGRTSKKSFLGNALGDRSLQSLSPISTLTCSNSCPFWWDGEEPLNTKGSCSTLAELGILICPAGQGALPGLQRGDSSKPRQQALLREARGLPAMERSFFSRDNQVSNSQTDTFVKSPLNVPTAHFSSASLPET